MDDSNIPRPPPAVSGTAKARKNPILAQFSAKVGKVQIVEKTVDKSVNKGASSSASAVHGFHCASCNASFTSSDAFLDHCNGKVHQRNLGMSVKVERVDEVDRVKARLQELTQKRHAATRIIESQTNAHFEQKLDEAEAESDRLKEDRKLRKKQKKSQINGASLEGDNIVTEHDNENDNDDMMAMMGFKSFT